MHPVEVCDQHVDVHRGRLIKRGGERLGEDQIVFMINVDCGQLIDFHDRRPPEEPVLRGAETGRVQHVERTGLAVVGLAVLAPRPARGVVVLPAHQPIAGGPPEKLIRRHRREHRIGAAVGDKLNTTVDILGHDERTGALDEDHDVGLLDEVVEGVQQHRFRGRQVAGQLVGPENHPSPGHLAAEAI